MSEEMVQLVDRLARWIDFYRAKAESLQYAETNEVRLLCVSLQSKVEALCEIKAQLVTGKQTITQVCAMVPAEAFGEPVYDPVYN